MVVKKHVLFIVENNSVPRDERVWSEAMTLKQLGYDVSIIAPCNTRVKERCADDLVVDGINIYQHPMPIEGEGIIGLILEYVNALFWEALLSFRIFLTHRFHAIHAANPPDNIFLIALPYKLFGVKFIFDHHDICPENFVAKFGKKGAFHAILRLLEWLTFKNADLVISTNESYKKIAIERGGKKAKDVFVVRNGPDLENIKAKNPNYEIKNGFKYLIGYVGVIGQQEGIENLLKSVEYIVKVKKITDILFVVIGKGPAWKQVTQQCTSMGLDGNIRFTGFIPDQELWDILAATDACVNPEFGNEFTDRSTMIKIMEYMTFGKPIVMFHTTEGEVSAGGSAIYVRTNSEIEFAETLLMLLNDQTAKRENMGNKGRKRIEEQLCWEKQKDNLIKAYDYLFDGKP